MKITLRCRGVHAAGTLQRLVEEQLHRLQPLVKIAAAQVILECQRETKPAFQVSASLEVPGPDFHAAAKDHSLRAALRKVVTKLEQQIRSRHAKRAGRRKPELRLSPQLSLWPVILTAQGHRA